LVVGWQDAAAGAGACWNYAGYGFGLDGLSFNRLESNTSISQLEEEVQIISQRFVEDQSNLQASAALDS
jgi:hypothetical protein